MIRNLHFVAVLLLSNSFLVSNAVAAFSTDAVMAGNVKRNQYQNDALIWGGDALANPVVLDNIRWAPNSGFERIVVDLSGEGAGWETKVPPYFQVGMDSGTKKIQVSIRGVSRRNLGGEKLSKSLSRSSLVASTYLAPAIEGDLASFEVQLKKAAAVEAFYLVNPPRIIVDIRAD